nr:protein alcs [Quercus suber]
MRAPIRRPQSGPGRRVRYTRTRNISYCDVSPEAIIGSMEWEKLALFPRKRQSQLTMDRPRVRRPGRRQPIPEPSTGTGTSPSSVYTATGACRRTRWSGRHSIGSGWVMPGAHREPDERHTYSTMATQTDTYQAAHSNRNLTAGGSPPLEKDFENGYHLDNNLDTDAALQRIRTTGSLSISPELFEKIYLSPQNRVAGQLRKTFANPTPLCLVGFLLSLTPLSCILMGWRGAGGTGASDIGAYFFFGGVLMIVGAVGEWIVGNTFPFVVFGSFGAFWLTFAATLQPFYNAIGAFADTGGVASPVFNASFGFFLLTMGFLCFIYLICALRTNITFVIIFITLVPAFGCLAGAYWHIALGNTGTANTLIIVAGALTFVTDVAGWWIFFAILLAALDFPFQLPVGDLSHIIRGASEKARAKEEHSA